MAKSRHPQWLTLRLWASKVERGLLPQDEANALAVMLRSLAAGDSLDEVFGVSRPAGRPLENRCRFYVEQVWGLTQSTSSGNPGMGVTAAMHEVASACHVAFDTVKGAYYSAEGQVHLDLIKNKLRDPFE